MIQRIQTVYLALALLLMGFLGWLPLGEIAAGIQVYTFNIKGVFAEGANSAMISGWPLMLLLSIIEVLQIVVIFSFKKRVRQMRISTFVILLMIGFFGVSWYFVHASLKTIGEGAYVFQMAMAFPLVAAILNYLAIRAIGKDEALVRSIDRIR